MSWAPVTKQSETWTNNQPTSLPRVGFSLGFAPRPAFMIAIRVGLWAERTEQSEVWTPQ